MENKKKLFRLDAQACVIWTADGPVRMRHHQAGRFLQALLAQSQRGQPVTAVMLAAQWQGAKGTPDRTAVRRALLSVRDALARCGSASTILALPRHETVGPWSLRTAAHEQWESTGEPSLSTAPEPAVAASPRLNDSPCAKAVLAILSAVCVADDFAHQGHYLDAADYLAERMPGLSLSTEAVALLLLRRSRWLRRGGRLQDAAGALGRAAAMARKAPPSVRADLVAEAQVQRARLAYDTDPITTSSRIRFARLHEHVDAAGSTQLRWECANLQAQAARRKLQHLLARARPPAQQVQQVQELLDEADHSFAAAFYWLASAADAYHLQAVLVNYAYHLQWLVRNQLHGREAATIDDVVEAWRLCQTIVERFDLPEDSAWDYIMLADLWLGDAQARHLLRSDARLWPRDRSPARPDFYVRGVELAHKMGNPRQKILALDRYAAFMREYGNATLAAQAKSDRDQLLMQHGSLASLLLREGLRAGGLPAAGAS